MPNLTEIKITQLKSMLWLKKKRLEQYNLRIYAEDENIVNDICKRYIEIETEIEKLK